MREKEAAVASGLLGVREVERKGRRVHEPAHGVLAVRKLLELSYVEDAVATHAILRDAGFTGKTARLFRDMKVVARAEHNGQVVVQPYIPGLNDDNLSNYADSTEEFGDRRRIPGEVVDSRKLEYKLHSLFSDVTLTDKLQLSSQRLQSARRLAACEPGQAAAMLTDYLRENGYPNARVLAGDYAKSIGRVRQVIHSFASTIVYKDCRAPANVELSVLHMTFDKFCDEPQWTVFGPLKYATEVQAIYQLCIRYDPEYIMFALGVETAMLQINVRNFASGECYTGALTGYSSLEGVYAQGHALPSELTAEQQTRLHMASHKVMPVLVDDVVIGTAVQVSDRHVVLNEHTLNSAVDADKPAYVRDERVVTSRSVAHDLCVVSREGHVAQWILRDAIVSERVVLCYSVPGGVEYSDVLQVKAVHDAHVILGESVVLRKGTSGAAVIALRDGALLGLFSTKRGINVVCSAFTSSAFQVVTDAESVATSEVGTSQLSDDVGNRTYEKMVKRGLQGFLEGIERATTSLYVRTPRGDVCAGTVANCGGSWLTTVDTVGSPVMMEGGAPLTFRSAGSAQHECLSPPRLLAPLPNVRYPVPGEKVFVFARSGTDVAMSMTRMVTHRLPDARKFFVEDFGPGEENMAGGLIVAEKDAAVVGQYVVPDFDAYGVKIVQCVEFALGTVAAQPLSVITEQPLIDMPSVVSDMCDFRDVSMDAMMDLASVGETLLSLLSRRSAYAKHRSIDPAVGNVVQRWKNDYREIMGALGWQTMDWFSFPGIDPVSVAFIFLAVYYLRDSKNFNRAMEKLMPELLSDVQQVDYGPDNPSRPSSTVTMVDPVSEGRLRQLEERLTSLTSLVRASASPPLLDDVNVMT